jgi:protein tyrosine kinase modulator
LLLDDVQPDVTPEVAAQDIKRAPPGKQVDAMAFRISYAAPRPELAQQVTDQLVSLFIEGNRRAREQQSEITTRFLNAELQQMKADLDLESKRISDFKSQHAGELPGDKDSNVLALASFQRNLEAENDAMNRAEQKKLYLESLSSELKQSKAGSQLISGLDQQLQKMTAQLAELQGRYTDQYPDLKNLRDQIAQVERIKAEAERQGSAPATSAPALPETSAFIDSQLNSQPANASTAIYQVDAQSKANKKEIADRHANIITLQKRIAELQLRLNSTPAREDALSALTRTHDQSLSDYNALLTKQSQAELAANLERRQEGEQFTVLQAPSLPMTTDFPNKLTFSLVGLGVGLVFGIVTATLAELLDGSIHSERDIHSMVTAPILAGVPHLATEAEKRVHRYQRVYTFAGALTMVLAMAAGTLFNVTH